MPDHCPMSHDLPGWLPVSARQYLAHTAVGLSLRDIARASGEAPSTVLRRVRRIEARREDPLLDEALRLLGHWAGQPTDPDLEAKEPISMT